MFINLPISVLISRAYSTGGPVDIAGLPGWARSIRYDIVAKSDKPVNAAERIEMIRQLLSERFRLALHFEKRELPSYDLVLARSDGKLGSGIASSPLDCDAQRAQSSPTASPAAPAPRPPNPSETRKPCTFLQIGTQVKGEGTLADLATLFRLATGRPIVDKTGLRGTWRVTLQFDPIASRRGPETSNAAVPEVAPILFTAVREQLGMKLESSTVPREVPVVDQLEPPTEN
jgi:uncharacterized protein (TIGR03435 family)